jgi:hypothetical protein
MIVFTTISTMVHLNGCGFIRNRKLSSIDSNQNRSVA